MRLHHALLTAGLLCISSSVVAGEAVTTGKFDVLDKDKDGAITINEATGQLRILRNWTDIDKNMDGQLEMSEFSAFESAVEFVPDNMENEDNIGAAPH